MAGVALNRSPSYVAARNCLDRSRDINGLIKAGVARSDVQKCKLCIRFRMSGARSFLARNTAHVDCIMFELLLLLSAFMRAMYFRCFQSTTDRLCLCFAQHPSEENLVKPAVVAARNHIKDTGSGSTGCSSPC